MAQPKELNFNEIETEQLIDLFEDDDETSDQEHLDITKFCIITKLLMTNNLIIWRYNL